LGSSAIVKVSEQVGAAKIRIARVPRLPGRGSQARFPSQVPQEEVPRKRFPGRGSQEQAPKPGSKARFPMVPRKRFPKIPKDSQRFPRAGSQARLPSKEVPKQGKGSKDRLPSKLPKQAYQARLPSKGSQARFPRKGSKGSRFPSNVSKNRFAGKVPKQRFPRTVSQDRFFRRNRFPRTGFQEQVSRNRFPRTRLPSKGSQAKLPGTDLQTMCPGTGVQAKFLLFPTNGQSKVYLGLLKHTALNYIIPINI